MSFFLEGGIFLLALNSVEVFSLKTNINESIEGLWQKASSMINNLFVKILLELSFLYLVVYRDNR